MTDSHADLRVICEAADEWAGEYGFVDPERAGQVLAAIYRACPEVLSQQTRAHFDAKEQQ